MKKIYLSVLLLTATFTVAAENVKDELNGMPEPVSGIHVVPDSEMSGTKEMKMDFVNRKREFKEKGYNYSDSTHPKLLLNLKYESTKEIATDKNNPNLIDTHLKETVKEIPLAFKFNGIPFLKKEEVIGYAAAGGYNEKKGWNGIGEFFTDPVLGTCSFTLFNIALSHGGARISESSVTYDVNKKPTSIGIDGSPDSGFVYTLAWYDNTFVHSIECANLKFNKDIMPKMIEYAKLIDKSIIINT